MRADRHARWYQDERDMTQASDAAAKQVRIATLLSIGSVGGSVLTQLLTPRVLQDRWGDAGYEWAIALQGIASVVLVADAGIQAYLTRELALLHDSPQAAKFRAVATAGLRGLASTGLVLTVLLSVAFAMLVRAPTSIVASRTLAAGVFALVTVSLFTSLACGGWATAVLVGSARYVRGHLEALVRNLVAGLSLPLLAYLGAGPVRALALYACGLMVVDLARFAGASRVLPRTTTDSPMSMREIMWQARGSFLLSLSGPVQTGLQPAVAAQLLAGTIAVGVPARTMGSAARLLTNAVINAIWVPLARQVAPGRPNAQHAWRTASGRMATLQLAAITFVMLVAPIVTPLWLPNKHAAVMRVVPIFLLEQACYICAAPSLLLLQSAGQFGRVAMVQLGGALVSLVLTIFLVPTYSALGFAIASALSTVLIVVPASALLERAYVHTLGGSAGPVFGLRLLITLSTVGAVVVFSARPLTGFCLACITTLASAAFSLRSSRER